MKYFIEFALCLILFFLVHHPINGQDFDSEDFGNQAAIDNWTSGGTNGGSTVWEWSDNPSVAIFNQQPPFASTSASNGFFYFDSDENGEYPHNVTLTSPAFDCSNQSVVYAQFQNQYTIFNSSSAAFLGVSTDGINFTDYPILSTTEPGDFNVAVQYVVVDITEQAAGEAEVYLQFRWEGNYEYAWKIDDLVLTSSDPNPPYDLSITEIQLPPNFQQPVSQLDIVRFKMEVENNGNMPQTNTFGIVEVIRNETTIFAATSEMIPNMEPGSTEILEFSEVWVQEGSGSYIVKYSVQGDNPETNPFDNTISKEFFIASNVFSKDDNNGNFPIQPDNVEENWETGNFYYMVNDGYFATRVFFSAVSDEDLEGKKVVVNLYQVTEDSDFNNFTDNDITLIGNREFTFTTQLSYNIVGVEFDNGPIPLEGGSEYIVTIIYPPELSAVFSPITYPYQVASVIRTDEWYLGGFGDDVTVVARLEVLLADAIQEQQLSDNNKISIYPNPSTTTLHVDIELEQKSNQSIIRIFNATGQLKYQKVLDNIQMENMEIDVSKYPVGVYMIRFDSDNGVRTLQFLKSE